MVTLKRDGPATWSNTTTGEAGKDTSKTESGHEAERYTHRVQEPLHVGKVHLHGSDEKREQQAGDPDRQGLTERPHGAKRRRGRAELMCVNRPHDGVRIW